LLPSLPYSVPSFFFGSYHIGQPLRGYASPGLHTDVIGHVQARPISGLAPLPRKLGCFAAFF
jgi:hypothetical protein